MEVKGFFRTSVFLNQSLEKYIEQAGPFKQNILPSNHKKHENIKSWIREQLFFLSAESNPCRCSLTALQASLIMLLETQKERDRHLG